MIPTVATAWQLSPEGSFIEKKLASRSQGFVDRMLSSFAVSGIGIIGNSVHEEVTNRALGCEGDADICGDPEYEPEHAYYLAGVRWNDDPPFRFSRGQGNFKGCVIGQTVRLITQPQCWGNTFKDGEARAAKGVALDGSNATLLVRSHFGDMQFLHAMGAADEESPVKTQARILAWAEFVWRTGLGEYDQEMAVMDIDLPGFSDLFQFNREWRIQDLFALGNPHVRSPDSMSKLAFGSLLHMVQDSFARGHVARRTPINGQMCTLFPSMPQPGKIVEFHSYSRQDPKKHGHSDSRNAFSAHWTADRPNVVDVGRTLYTFYEQKRSWTEVQPYVKCIFALDIQARAASAGEDYAMGN
ncbi:MAG TPA: hypothetical protein VL001_05405 [Candidimonas sp.]|nr:hypothetical protein [Candidimonas sp.]